jgi:hypothetical protein
MTRGFTKRWGLLALAGLAAALLTVRPSEAAKKDATTRARDLTARLDQRIAARLAAEKVPASPRADDAELMRRVYLDLTGVIPTAEQAAAFLDSKDTDKRRQLIDELLASPKFGRHMADIWQGLLLTRNSDNRRLQGEPLVVWLEKSFNANKPWDQFVTALLTASGPQDKNGAVTYFLANATVDKITDNVTKNFLGVQLQCAQCHNHPFTGWKQEEYWGMAAFFLKVRPDNVNRVARNGGSPGVTEAPGGRGRPQRLPDSAKVVPARFLQGEQPKLRDNQPLRPVLAKWLTSSKNPYFARAMVNRVWGQLLGRGLVHPVDDMQDGNPPAHPELLQELADGFAAGGFDVKELYRTLCNSETYQRTSRPVTGNEDAEALLFSRMAIKTLTPEQLYDSLTQVTGPARAVERPGRAAAGRAVVRGPREQFVNFFRVDEGADPTEYQAGIPQVLRLMNSPQLTAAGLVNRLGRANTKPEEAIEHLFLATLSRRPKAQELDKLLAHVKKVGAKDGYSDVVWALLNSSEFTLNH